MLLLLSNNTCTNISKIFFYQNKNCICFAYRKIFKTICDNLQERPLNKRSSVQYLPLTLLTILVELRSLIGLILHQKPLKIILDDRTEAKGSVLAVEKKRESGNLVNFAEKTFSPSLENELHYGVCLESMCTLCIVKPFQQHYFCGFHFLTQQSRSTHIYLYVGEYFQICMSMNTHVHQFAISSL